MGQYGLKYYYRPVPNSICLKTTGDEKITVTVCFADGMKLNQSTVFRKTKRERESKSLDEKLKNKCVITSCE